MNEVSKARSPFYPGQPVPPDLFVGRSAEIDRILRRGVGQVAQGKPAAIFAEGEYGIGKSSIASLVQRVAERDYNLHGIYATLSGCTSLTDVARSILEATVRSGAFEPNRAEKIREWLATYVGKQELFGLSVDMGALKQGAPTLTSHFQMLDFLAQVKSRLADTGVKGIFLVLDEINGVSQDPQFAHFIKGLVDANAMAKDPLPLLLMLCGVPERRYEMIERHQPVDRIFDIVTIGPLSSEEMKEFFKRAFEKASMTVTDVALDFLTFYSAGFPKIMYLIGDAAFWIDKNGHVTEAEAIDAVLMAAEDVGKKYVDQQVYKAIRSDDYHAILQQIGKSSPADMSFVRSDVLKGLKPGEQKKFDNFVQRMKKLNVIRSGESKGEYVFNVRMVRLYIWIRSQISDRQKT